MADNTDEEHLDHSTNTQSENPLNEITPTADTETINPKQESENMEVHHHPDLHHKPKPWKEYLLEGLMIFLAVTMGFIAENIREKITDKERLHDYVLSLTGDLKSDIALYDSSIRFNNRYSQMIDTIFQNLTSEQGDIGKVYIMARRLTMGSSLISPDSKTFEQMKGSGGLRLIHKQAIADSVGAYYLWTKKFEYWSDLQKERLGEVINSNSKIFSANIFYKIVKEDSLENMQANLLLTGLTKADINDILMHEQYYFGILKLMNQRATQASIQAKRLIIFLQKEYHLEHE
jgi:hypothetical protein